MTSAAADVPGSPHGHETIAAVQVRRLAGLGWPLWRKRTVWRASCDCGWRAEYLSPGEAGRALAQHPNWDMLARALPHR